MRIPPLALAMCLFAGCVLDFGEIEDEGSADFESLITPPWPGLIEIGSVKRHQIVRFETPSVGPGSYRIALAGTGDADLYVRIGAPPTVLTYHCRPFKTGSNESCEVSLAQPGTLHLMVRGHANHSEFKLGAKPL